MSDYLPVAAPLVPAILQQAAQQSAQAAQQRALGAGAGNTPQYTQAALGAGRPSLAPIGALGTAPAQLALPAAGQTTTGLIGQATAAGAGAAGAGRAGAGAGAGAGIGSVAPTVATTAATAAPNVFGRAAAGLVGSLKNPGRALTFGGQQLLGAGVPAGLLRGGIYNAAGELGAQVLGGMDVGGANSVADSALTWASRGAGAGASFGLLGAGIGGAAGAVGGALASAFGIGHQQSYNPQQRADTMQRVTTALGMAGVPAENRQQFVQSLNAQFALLDPDAPDYNTQVRTLMEMIPGAAAELIAQAPALREQANSRLTPEDIMSIQAQVGGFMNQYTQPMIDQAQTLGSTLQQTADTLPPAYRNAMNVQAQTLMSNAANMAAAYQASTQAMPAFMAYQQALSNSYQQPQSAATSGALANVDPATLELLQLNG